MGQCRVDISADVKECMEVPCIPKVFWSLLACPATVGVASNLPQISAAVDERRQARHCHIASDRGSGDVDGAVSEALNGERAYALFGKTKDASHVARL